MEETDFESVLYQNQKYVIIIDSESYHYCANGIGPVSRTGTRSVRCAYGKIVLYLLNLTNRA